MRDIEWLLTIKYKLKQASTSSKPQATCQAPVKGIGLSATTYSSAMISCCTQIYSWISYTRAKCFWRFLNSVQTSSGNLFGTPLKKYNAFNSVGIQTQSMS